MQALKQAVTVALLALPTGCERGNSAPDATPPAPARSGTAPQQSSSTGLITPKASIAVVLEAELDPKQPATRRVLVAAPALGLREPIADVSSPNTCESFVTPTSEWRVSCTPKYRHTLASVKREATAIVLLLSPLKGPPRSIRHELPSAADVALTESLVEPRAAPCDGAAQGAPIGITFRSNNFYHGHEPSSQFMLMIAGKPAATLVTTPMWWLGCKQFESEAAVSVVCKGGKHAMKAWTEGASVRFSWHEAERYQGTLLVPCDRRPELHSAPCLNCNNAYF